MVVLERRGLHTFYYCSNRDAKIIKDCLTMFMPGAEFSTLFREKKWDGKVKYYDDRGKWFWFGLIEYVLDALSKKRVKYQLIGYDDQNVDWINFSDPFLLPEREYQRQSIIEFLTRTYGIVMVPTRGGKTFIASEIIRLTHDQGLSNSTLFLVDNVDLFKQAIGDISKISGIKESDIGRIRGEEFEIRSVNVGMIQTIQSALKGKTTKKIFTKQDVKDARNRKNNMSKFLRNLDFMIIDEVQEYGNSKPRLSALRKASNLKLILSISATPHKYSNELHRFNVDSFCGGIIYEIEENTLVDSGVLSKNRVLLLSLEHKYKPWNDSKEYRDVVKEVIINDDVRNSIIVSFLTICDSLDLKTLAMFNSVEHGALISKTTGYTFLSGEDKETTRETTKKSFLSKKGGVLLVSDIWKKGITLPSVEILLNVDSGKEATLIIQRRGRVLGVTETKKKALAVDIIDSGVRYLDEHSENRIYTYENKVGVENIDVIEFGPNFATDIEDYLINWFELNLQ